MEKKRKLYFAAGILIIITAVLLIFFLQGQKSFKFAGVEWKKINYEGEDVYYSKFRIMAGLPVFTAILKNEPRTNYVEVETPIFFKFYPETFIALDSNMKDCGENAEAIEIISGFLSSLNVRTKQAVNDINLSKSLGYDFENCLTIADTNKTLIILEKSDYPFIWQSNKNCYILRVGQCESRRTAEAFMLDIMIQLEDIERIMSKK